MHLCDIGGDRDRPEGVCDGSARSVEGIEGLRRGGVLDRAVLQEKREQTLSVIQ